MVLSGRTPVARAANLRQTGLLQLMAQIGSLEFRPLRPAGSCDPIFTRWVQSK